MNILSLENFKAFHQPFSLECPNGENVLIYGENGSGKSSLYDAFRLFYFRDKIFKERIPPNVVEDRQDEEAAVVASFDFDKGNEHLVLNIDNTDYTAYQPNGLQVFLLSYNNIHPQNEADDCINIRQLVTNAYYLYDVNEDDWLDDEAELFILGEVNKALNETFYMDGLVLSPSVTEDKNCTLELNDRVEAKKEHLSRYFNEASIHLVRFLILIECMSFVRNTGQHSLLVMDDCFNSLDATNRTFMMSYVFRKTKGVQKIILTHNLSYYNLMSHILTTQHEEESWLKYILCLVDGCYVLRNEETSGTDDIISKRNDGYYSNSEQLGNAIRQHFEVLVYRLSMLCNIGAMPESKDLLDKLCTPNHPIFLSVDDNKIARTAVDLINEIYANVTNGNEYKLADRMKEKIDKFRANDILQPLIPALIELRLLQKVALHQASHGHTGIPPVQSREFDVSLALLKKMEAAINSIKNVDMSTI